MGLAFIGQRRLIEEKGVLTIQKCVYLGVFGWGGGCIGNQEPSLPYPRYL